MRASEMTGTIKIGNLQLPVTGHIEYVADEAVEMDVKMFNEQLRRLRDMKVTLTYEVVRSAGTDGTWLSRLYAEIEEKPRHYEQVQKLAKCLARKRRHYWVEYRPRWKDARRQCEY